MTKFQKQMLASMDDFDIQNQKTKFIANRLIRVLTMAVNKEKLSYGTIRYIYRQVLIKTDLTRPKKSKKLFDLPTTEDIQRFFTSIDDPQVKLFFLLIHNTGLRVSEACNLKVNQIDFTNNTLFIQQGKGSKDRLVPVTNSMLEKIEMFLHGKNHKFLFESKLGTAFTPRRIEQICKDLKIKAQINKKFTPHTFRHFYFTKLAEQGLDIDIRALIAGHSNSRTQEIYSHVGLDGTKELILKTLEKMQKDSILK